MDLYTELLHECNACICSGILSEQKKFCRRLMIVDMQCLTKSQYEYLLMKVENCISDYYNNLSNEELKLRYQVPYDRNKGMLLKAMLKTLNHNKTKFDTIEYNRLLAEIITSAFRI